MRKNEAMFTVLAMASMFSEFPMRGVNNEQSSSSPKLEFTDEERQIISQLSGKAKKNYLKTLKEKYSQQS